MALYKNDIVDINLDTGNIHRSFLNHTIGMSDKMANRFGVRLFRNGEPVNIAGGSCAGYFMAPNGVNILVDGEGQTGVDYNLAWVQLPQACYNVEGQFSLAIKITDENDAVIGTMRIVDGVVSNTGTQDPQTTYPVPTYEDLEALIEQMLEAKAGSVRYDIDQDLTTAERTQARENIGMVLIEFVQIDGNKYVMDVSTDCDFVSLGNDKYALVMHAD